MTDRERKRDELMNALREYIDARIHYAASDPEWRSDPSVEYDRLDKALEECLNYE